jgi:hypothetical protein
MAKTSPYLLRIENVVNSFVEYIDPLPDLREYSSRPFGLVCKFAAGNGTCKATSIASAWVNDPRSVFAILAGTKRKQNVWMLLFDFRPD